MPKRTGIMIALALVAACTTPAAPVTTPQTFAPIVTEDSIIGSGVITFGTAYDEDTLTITSPKSTFRVGAKKIAWSASLVEPVGATTITLIVASKTKSGAEKVLYNLDVDVSNPAFDIIANAADVASVVGRRPGTYVMRYLREGTVLAEGEFTLVR